VKRRVRKRRGKRRAHGANMTLTWKTSKSEERRRFGLALTPLLRSIGKQSPPLFRQDSVPDVA